MRAFLPYLLIIAGILVFFLPFLRDTATTNMQQRMLSQWEQTGMGDRVPTPLQQDSSTSSEDVEDVRENPGESTAESRRDSAPLQLVPVGFLHIDSIDLRLPIFSGTGWAELQVGVGVLEETAGLDEVGNTVLTAHRSHSHGMLFNRLDEVELEDRVIVESEEGRREYIVRNTEVVGKEQATDFTGVSEYKQLTLITCDPLGVVNPPDRLVVVAEPAE